MTGETLAGFLEELAAGPPGPAAGSAIAVAVAMAAALTEMTAGRCHDGAAASRAAAFRARALALAKEDVEAYGAVLASKGEERTSALSHATDVPLEIAEVAAETAGLAAALPGDAARAAGADAAAAVELAEAGMRAAARLVLANLRGEGDDPRVSAAQAFLRDTAASSSLDA